MQILWFFTLHHYERHHTNSQYIIIFPKVIMVQMRLLWSIRKIHPEFYYESAKFIWVTYLVTLPNMRKCERIQNQTLSIWLKNYVMILNDYVYESVSNIANFKIIDSSWLRSQKFDSGNKFVF
jgi:hypothetical protein